MRTPKSLSAFALTAILSACSPPSSEGEDILMALEVLSTQEDIQHYNTLRENSLTQRSKLSCQSVKENDAHAKCLMVSFRSQIPSRKRELRVLQEEYTRLTPIQKAIFPDKPIDNPPSLRQEIIDFRTYSRRIRQSSPGT